MAFYKHPGFLTRETGYRFEGDCPLCGCGLLTDGEHVWCSSVQSNAGRFGRGHRETESCSFGVWELVTIEKFKEMKGELQNR